MVFKFGETDIKRKTRDSSNRDATINPPSTMSDIETLNESDDEETVSKRETEVMNEISYDDYFYASCFGKKEVVISDQEEEPDLAQRKSDMDFLALNSGSYGRHECEVQFGDKFCSSKVRCVIGFLVFGFIEFNIMCLYWRRILDALINPAVAIYMQTQPENSSSIIGFNHFTLQHQDNTSFIFWKFNDPSTWQLVYHFPVTLLYLYFILLTIILFINVIVTGVYLDNDIPHNYFQWPDWAKKRQDFLSRHVVYAPYADAKGMKLESKFMLCLALVGSISVLDSMLLCWFCGQTIVRLPFNWFVLDLVRSMAGYSRHNLAIMFPIIGLECVCFIGRVGLPIKILDCLYDTGIARAEERKEKYNRKRKIANRLYKKRFAEWNDEMRQTKLQKTCAVPIYKETTTQAKMNREDIVNSADGTTRTEDAKNKGVVIVGFKDDDTPPSYEKEALVPTYDEAIGLALNTKK